jgi:hypothetical protein
VKIIKAILLTLFLSAIILVGCSGQTESEYPLLPYPPVVVWDNKAYFVTEEVIQEDQIGEQIGVVKRYIDPNKAMPEFDGDSTIAQVGSGFYQINGLEMSNFLAIYIDNEFRKAFREDI